MEDRYDNQSASRSIRMDATAHRCFPRDLVRVPGGKCRDVVPKCGRRVAHDEVHCVSPLDRADADSNDAARFSCGLSRRGARRYLNRRRLLLATQGLILVTAAMLSVLTFAGLMNVPLLLGFTFVLGMGAILSNPAWQAVNAELVPPNELPEAVTLSSVSYNLARGGPSISGSAHCGGGAG